MKRTALVSCEPIGLGRDEWKIVIHEHPSSAYAFFCKVLGMKQPEVNVRTFVGSYAIWHEEPSWDQADIDLSMQLYTWWHRTNPIPPPYHQ